ncbi:hypothetical protein QC762_306150 [Podospora pseudocomata]|uniref:SAP domain-containing protein n=1 Tax=Podospora pseudocomata TaxID=2093779 RepID=A0ABR0GJD3_9PEZI|nr:hypothetical protein QC762_306150 [Podospora pseudocomata]
MIKTRASHKTPTMTTTKLPLPGKLTVAQLQSLCSSTGLPQAGSKPTIQQTLRQAAQSAQHIPDTARILSIDLGLKNFAFSLLTPASSPSEKTPLPTPPDSSSVPQALLPPVTLHHWNHLNLTTPLLPQDDPVQFTPSSLSSLTYSLISTHLLPLKPTHILIERQRFRTGNASNIFEWTIRVNTLESMLHACFATLKGVDLFHGNVISISPKTVAGYLFPKSEAKAEGGGKSQNAYHLLKANKVGMLGEWLQQGKLIKPQDQGAGMAKGFLEAWRAKGVRGKKKREMEEGVLGRGVKLDDLSDSVLQGMVWLQWQRNLEGLRGVDFGEEEKGVAKAISKVKKGTGRIKHVDVHDEGYGGVEVDAVLEGGGGKKKSGRRKKTAVAQEVIDEVALLETPKKSRGRSKKVEGIEEAEDIGTAGTEPVKKRPGRRKKASVEEENAEEVVLEADTKKKSRGRLRKAAVGGSDKVEVAAAEMKISRRRSARIESNEDDIVLI